MITGNRKEPEALYLVKNVRGYKYKIYVNFRYRHEVKM